MYHRISPAAMAQIFIKGHDVNLGKTKQLNVMWNRFEMKVRLCSRCSLFQDKNSFSSSKTDGRLGVLCIRQRGTVQSRF